MINFQFNITTYNFSTLLDTLTGLYKSIQLVLKDFRSFMSSLFSFYDKPYVSKRKIIAIKPKDRISDEQSNLKMVCSIIYEPLNRQLLRPKKEKDSWAKKPKIWHLEVSTKRCEKIVTLDPIWMRASFCIFTVAVKLNCTSTK